MRSISTHTYAIAKLLAELKNAETRALVLMKESKVPSVLKGELKLIVSRCNAGIRGIKHRFSPELAKLLEADTLSDETGLQLEAVSDMFCSLPKGIRDEIESYVESRYNVYAVKKETA